MNYLLDTHIAYWCLYNPNLLPLKTRFLLDDQNNDLYVSAASIWEVSNKHIKKSSQMLVS